MRSEPSLVIGGLNAVAHAEVVGERNVLIPAYLAYNLLAPEWVEGAYVVVDIWQVKVYYPG